jgi:hypothetical protein
MSNKNPIQKHGLDLKLDVLKYHFSGSIYSNQVASFFNVLASFTLFSDKEDLDITNQIFHIF